MSTEVKHGPSPIFEASLTGGSFDCLVRGYYTATPNLAAAGVQFYKFDSDQPVKQQAELLALRTAFLEWFLETYQELGGTRAEAIGQVQFIVNGWREPA